MADLSPDDVLQKVAESATDSAAKQYDDYSKTFVALDGKGQSASTVGSVLLGVIVALANAGKLNGLVQEGGWYLALLALPVVAALLAMITGVLASRVARVNVPYDTERQIEEFNDLFKLPKTEVSQAQLIGFHASRHRQWAISLRNMADAIQRKGALVVKAQWAAVVCAVLTVVVLLVALTMLK